MLTSTLTFDRRQWRCFEPTLAPVGAPDFLVAAQLLRDEGGD